MINKGVHGEIPKSDNWTIDTAPRLGKTVRKLKHKKRIKFKRSKRTIHSGPSKSSNIDNTKNGKIISIEEVKAKKEENSKATKISKAKKSKKTKAKAGKVSVAEMKIPDKHKANVEKISSELSKVEAQKLEKFKSTQGLGLASSIFMPILGVPLTMINYNENANAIQAMKRLQASSQELKSELKKIADVSDLKSDYQSYGEDLLKRFEDEVMEEFGSKAFPEMNKVHKFMDKFMQDEKATLVDEIKKAEDFETTIKVAVKIVSEETIWNKLDGPLTTKRTATDLGAYVNSVIPSLDTSIYSPKVKIVRPKEGRPVTFPGEIVDSHDTRTKERKEKDFLESVLNTVIEGLLLSNNDRTGRKYKEVHKINPEGPLDLIINQFHKAKNALYRFFKWTTDDLDDKTKTKLKKAAHKASEALGLEDFRRGDQKVQNTIHNVFEASKNPESSRVLRSQVVNTLADVVNGLSEAAKKPREISIKANSAKAKQLSKAA